MKYPFESQHILRKKKSIKRELLSKNKEYVKKNIAILGGSTTHDIKELLEIFLLDYGIKPEFYESQYNQYFEDAVFGNSELESFCPDIIYIHTSTRNIIDFPTVKQTNEEITSMLNKQYHHFEMVWQKLNENYLCPIIQNNFEAPFYRLLGNMDTWNNHGKCNYINRLNNLFYEYAQTHSNFYINDINYLASCYGLKKWSDPFSWNMYKYACSLSAIPELAYNISNIIKSIYGKNKKAFVLDLDNTLWGGTIGDDGPENIDIGQETPIGQIYSDFQKYIKEHLDLGITININSKNNENTALEGLKRPDSILKPEDFIIIKANWESKDKNIIEISKDLNIGTDSMVFIDDNPAERFIVESQVRDLAVPEIDLPEHFIDIIDRAGYFEVTTLSEDDFTRNQMYKANMERVHQETTFAEYSEYLKSLNMKAEIRPFNKLYYSRIAQLTNKSNQFNLTTRRCSQSDIENIANNNSYITLYGKLIDKFGDNGVVSVMFGHLGDEDVNTINEHGQVFHIDLWLMSCRVLKRDFEYAMMDETIRICHNKNVIKIKGYYYPTVKNDIVKNFYELQDFNKTHEDKFGNSIWEFLIPEEYNKKNQYIKIC